MIKWILDKFSKRVDITDSLEVPVLDEAKMLWERYQDADRLINEGKLQEAAEILEKSCEVPSIAHGHYRKLFQVWRKLNKESLKNGNYDDVVNRVMKAIKYNEEMLLEMARYWGAQRKENLAKDHFKKYSHLKVTDIKNLITASKALGNNELIEFGEKHLKQFINK